MAFVKPVIHDEEGNLITYNSESDLRNLIYYVCRRSFYIETINLYPLGVEGYKDQFMYCQLCRGKAVGRRALHYILSFDSKGWEWQIDQKKLVECLYAVWGVLHRTELQNHQCILAAHDNGNNRHIHIVINPVNMNTKKILNYGVGEYRAVLKEIAIELFCKFEIAIQGISYIGEDERLRFANKTPILYENRNHSWEPHLRR